MNLPASFEGYANSTKQRNEGQGSIIEALSQMSEFDTNFDSKQFSLVQWTPIGKLQAMGKTSAKSALNFPGRYAWAAAEIIGPINLLFILYTLPAKLVPSPVASTSVMGTGMPIQNEILGALYILHYINRAIIQPLFLAPSMSPIHPMVSIMMAGFQYTNSTNIACWIIYSATSRFNMTPLVSIASVIGLFTFLLGLAGNITSEMTLYDLRRAAAKRKARSEGKATITFDKVYVIPPAEGPFKQILYPHYVLEWLEWAGYAILGGAWGLGWGWGNAGLWFFLVEICTMLPRAVTGKYWYEQKFGKRALAGRAAAIPGLGL